MQFNIYFVTFTKNDIVSFGNTCINRNAKYRTKSVLTVYVCAYMICILMLMQNFDMSL